MTDLDESGLLELFRSLSNWGRWGPEDQRGTLNLISAEKRASALRSVRLGISVSCAWTIDATIEPHDHHPPPQRFMMRLPEPAAPREFTDLGDGEAVTEFLGLVYHGTRFTHADALAHYSWNGHLYNGRSTADVTAALGATTLDVTGSRDGIITRALLVDVPRHRGVDWLEPGELVGAEEVLEIVHGHDVDIEEGDALLLRTGHGHRRRQEGLHDRRTGNPGWHPSCLPLFRDRGVSLIGSDTVNDAQPPLHASVSAPIHAVGICAMGLWLLDNCNLEDVADLCEQHGAAAFAFIVSTLPFRGATGSPINPLAVL